MEIRYRIGRLVARCAGRIQRSRRDVRRVYPVGLLLAVAGAGYGDGTPESAPSAGAPPDRLPIIVNLAVDTGSRSGSDSAQTDRDAFTVVREPVIDLLRTVLTDSDFAAVRIYENIPAIALSATAEVIALLMAMPEVASIECDREFTILEDGPQFGR